VVANIAAAGERKAILGERGTSDVAAEALLRPSGASLPRSFATVATPACSEKPPALPSSLSSSASSVVGGSPIALLAADEAYAIHTDHLGTPQLMTDENGTAVWSADYAPFGEATVTLDTVPLALRFPGQYADAETGLHYNHFRDYDPTLGRYLSAAPAGRVDGPNRYLYALARPLERTDVLGLWSRGDSLSPERLAELDNNPAAIARFVTEELPGFSDRQRFYDYAHQTLQTADGAIQTDWFRAASDVNRWNELGPAGWPSAATPLGSDSDDYLTYAGIALALQNVQTFATLMRGDDIAGVGCLRGDDLDLALVGYEQRQLSRITDFFFGDRRPPGGPPETGANAIARRCSRI